MSLPVSTVRWPLTIAIADSVVSCRCGAVAQLPGRCRRPPERARVGTVPVCRIGMRTSATGLNPAGYLIGVVVFIAGCSSVGGESDGGCVGAEVGECAGE